MKDRNNFNTCVTKRTVQWLLKIKQCWNTYKRDRWLRDSQKNMAETEFIFRRMREICDRLSISRSELNLSEKQKIASIASKEYQSQKEQYSLHCRLKSKKTDYTQIEMEDWPEQQKQACDNAFIYEGITGFLWTVYEWKNKWLIKAQQINELDKELWMSVRFEGNKPEDVNVFGIYLDFLWSDYDELTRFKGLYFSERNKSLFYHLLCCKDSPELEDRLTYEMWVKQANNLGELIKGY